MKKYVCSICGYVYDEQKEGVKFEDLPASWSCPLCGAPKSAFKEKIEKQVGNKKYVCAICGYVYDEQKEGVKFEDLPASWTCPLCGAPKSAFKEQSSGGESNAKTAPKAAPATAIAAATTTIGDRQLDNAELCIMCTNLQKGCEKQYRAEEAALFGEIATYFEQRAEKAEEASVDDLQRQLAVDLADKFPKAFDIAKTDADRGALRILTWSEKVSKIMDSIIARYKSEGTKFLENAKIFVCEICGFIYIGDEAPDICPICKVPKFKIHQVGRV